MINMIKFLIQPEQQKIFSWGEQVCPSSRHVFWLAAIEKNGKIATKQNKKKWYSLGDVSRIAICVVFKKKY